MSATGGRSGDVSEVRRRRGRPRLRKKSIAELDREMVMKSGQKGKEKETRRGGGENGGERADLKPEEVERGKEVVEESGESELMCEHDAVGGGYEAWEGFEDGPKPVGRSIGSAASGGKLYAAFEWEGKPYKLEDAIMVTPEDLKVKPRVAILKEIRQAVNGDMFATSRWLYRPEKVNIKADLRWLLYDPRELLLTDHKEEVRAVMIMYKCVVHFLPSHKQLLNRKVHPGFVVQHFYDHLKQRVFNISDEDSFKVSLRREICVRMRETKLRIGDVPNIVYGDKTAYLKGFENLEPLLGENISPLSYGKVNISPEKQALERPDEQISTQQQKMKAPRLYGRNPYINILRLFGVLKGDNRRDIYFERLLEGMHSHWNFITSGLDDGRSFDHNSEVIRESAKSQKGSHLIWPDSAVRLIFSLENETDIAYGTDIQKYNKKMRQLVFNLKDNRVLAKRFMTQELTPSMLLNMSPSELKAGFTAEELPRNGSDDMQEIQMVNAHCQRCSKNKVRLLNVIQAGAKQRYQLECTECGAEWFASSIIGD